MTKIIEKVETAISLAFGGMSIPLGVGIAATTLAEQAYGLVKAFRHGNCRAISPPPTTRPPVPRNPPPPATPGALNAV